MTITVEQIFTTIETAVVTAITNQGLYAEPFETSQCSQLPMVQMGLTSVDGEQYAADQAYGIGMLEYRLQLFVGLSDTTEVDAQRQLRAYIVQIFNALGSDPTLGEACAWSGMQPGTVDVIAGAVATDANRALRYVAAFKAMPHPNTAQ